MASVAQSTIPAEARVQLGCKREQLRNAVLLELVCLQGSSISSLLTPPTLPPTPPPPPPPRGPLHLACIETNQVCVNPPAI